MNSRFRPGLFSRHKKKKTEDIGQESTNHAQQDSNMTVSPTPMTSGQQQSSSYNETMINDFCRPPSSSISLPSTSSLPLASSSSTTQTTSVIHGNQEDQLLSNFERYSRPFLLSHLQDLKSGEENKKKDDKRGDDQQLRMISEIPPIDSFMLVSENERRSRFFKEDFLRQGLILLSSLEREAKDSLILKAVCVIDQKKRMDLRGTNILLTLFFESTKNRKKLNEILEGIHDSSDTIQVIVKSFDSQVIVVDFFEDEASDQESILPEYLVNTMSTNNKQNTNVDLLSCLKSFSSDFNNPSSSDFLKDQLLHSSNDNLTLFKEKHDHNQETILLKNHLRKIQKQKWSSIPLKEGIIKMKNNHYIEALQLFNRSLSIDKDYNADALVARACLKANNSQLEAALSDFEAALIIDPNHDNGKRYLSMTLMSLGDQKKHKDLDFTIKMYQKAIQADESNEDAKQGLQILLDDKKKRRKEFDFGEGPSSSGSSSSSSSSSRRRRRRSRSRSFSPVRESKTKAEEAVEISTSNLLSLPSTSSSSERNKSLRSSYGSSSSSSDHHHQRNRREDYYDRKRDNDYHRHDHHYRSYNRNSHQEDSSSNKRYNNNFRGDSRGNNRNRRQELPKETISRLDEEDKRQLEKIHQQMNF